MLITTTFVFLAVLPFTIAQQACTEDAGLPYTVSSTDDTGCAQKYGSEGTNDSAALNACYCLAGIGENCDSVDTRELKTVVRKRDTGTFTCTSSEICYINPADGGPFCLDSSTGDYVDATGGHGNVNTGEYTAADESGTTSINDETDFATSTDLDSTATSSSGFVEATTSESSSVQASATSNTMTSSVASPAITSTTLAGSTSVSAATVASTTSAAGAGRIGVGAVGALGLALGLIL